MEVGKTPKEIRQAIRQGRYTGGTAGLAPGYVQANLVVLPRAQAYDFLVFCQRNPRPCPRSRPNKRCRRSPTVSSRRLRR